MRKILFAFMCAIIAFTFCACSGTKDFSSVYPWAKGLKEEDITEIRTESGGYGVSPAQFKRIGYSNDAEDIKNVYSLLQQKLKPIVYEERCGGGYTKYTVYAGEKKYDFTVRYGSYVEIRGRKAWVLSDFELPYLENTYLDCYTFGGIAETCEVFSDEKGEKAIGTITGLKGQEFKEIEQTYADDDIKFYIDTGVSTRLKVVSEKVFVNYDRAYEMTGDIDLTKIEYYTAD